MTEGLQLPLPPGYFGAILEELRQHPDGARRRDLAEPVADRVQLTAAQREQWLPSGKHLTYRHRIGWALNMLKHAGLIEAVRHGVWSLTTEGRRFVEEHPFPLSEALSSELARRARRAMRVTSDEPDEPDKHPDDTAPEERIELAVRQVQQTVARELLDLIAKSPPSFFETLVLDLLHAMGYGLSRSSLQQVGGSGDGGIDGIISLDRLGLEKVYVQAKRWKDNIGRPHIQGFFGALAGRRASKGVFITTSSFSREAEEFASQVSDSIVLVDGRRLTELMVEHGVGVTHETLRIPKIDSDYFEES